MFARGTRIRRWSFEDPTQLHVEAFIIRTILQKYQQASWKQWRYCQVNHAVWTRFLLRRVFRLYQLERLSRRGRQIFSLLPKSHDPYFTQSRVAYLHEKKQSLLNRSCNKTLLKQDQGNDRLTNKNEQNPDSSYHLNHILTRKEQTALANRAQLPPIKPRPLHSKPPLFCLQWLMYLLTNIDFLLPSSRKS